MSSSTNWVQQPSFLVYTMTSGLGDYLVMGDLLRKARRLLPESNAVVLHRANPHIKLWPDGVHNRVFYNIYSPLEMCNLIGLLRSKRRQGCLIFGMQMSPGSLQGFALHRCLKLAGAMDYIVDFNLINADLITFTQDGYILDRQLNQLRDLFKIEIPSDFYQLQLPLANVRQTTFLTKKKGRRLVGVHPWSRRGTDSFFWPLNNWIELIRELMRDESIDIVLLGKDRQFESFASSLRHVFGDSLARFYFVPTNSVEDLVQTIAGLDMVLTVHTAVVHIGNALDKKMVVLTGATLDLWNPKKNNILLVTDAQAVFAGNDKPRKDKYLPQVARIEVRQVLQSFESLVRQS